MNFPVTVARFLSGVMVTVALNFAATSALAEPLPSSVHVGVASCAGSTCHGTNRAFAGVGISQGEYLLWQREDAHARAYVSLRNAQSSRIAKNLGLPRAWEAGECLACHADAPANPLRGAGHKLSDGVGCEACHGGAQGWLASHSAGYKTNELRKRAGLYPLWQPQARATLCLSCHQGDAARPMTHRLMSAGHPPPRFELDTYMTVMPAHHVPDADYAARKGAPDAAGQWIEGQLASASSHLDRLRASSAPGRFPELSDFDCNACHHSLLATRWQLGLAPPLGVGAVRLADTPMRMLASWLEVVDPGLAAQWRKALAALHTASQTSVDEQQARAGELTELLEQSVRPRLRDAALRKSRLLAGLHHLLVEHRDGASGADFSSAEQLAMASAVLFTALKDNRQVRITPDWTKALDGLYAAVRDRDRFEVDALRRAAGAADTALTRATLPKGRAP